ncbi:MAG: helix-turn-helix transcriptional regulator [Pseudomonadota bacterium]
MTETLTKLDRAALFRRRLRQAMDQAGATQSGLARAVGVDRSTLSQALTDDAARMPSAHLVGGCAEALGISSDWLLGLSDRPENAADLIEGALELTEAPRALVDERIFGWHREAQGYKIRHVPAGLPDMFKTDEMLEWEYAPHLGRTARQAIGHSRDRLDWMRQAQSDYEIALPLYEVQSFAAGTGYYDGLPAALRRSQLDQLQALTEQLYPRTRVYLFNARTLYSAPITVFGPLLAVVYTGAHYMAFRDRVRVETLTAQFDALVREASVTAREIPAHLGALRARIR